MSDVPFDLHWRKARRQHSCCWCRTTIQVGESHAVASGQFDGDWQNWRMHRDCKDIASEVTECGEQLCDRVHERGKACCECDDSLPLPKTGALANRPEDRP